MKDKEDTRLKALAKAVVAGNRKNAMRICLNQVKAVNMMGKRGVWEVWHQQLANPDKKPIEIRSYTGKYMITPADREFLTLLLNGMEETEFKDFRERFFKKKEDLEYEYQKNRLSFILMTYIMELNQSSKKSSAPKSRRTRPVEEPVPTNAP